MLKRLFIFLLLFLAGCSSIEKTTLFTGISNSPIKGKDIFTQFAGVRWDLDTTKYTKLPPKYGNIDLSLELYGGIAQGSVNGHTYGTTIFLRYSYPIGKISPYLELGAGPTILTIPTHEQEKSGFAFRDQIGVGVELEMSEDISILVGYRFEHISHGGLRSTRNRGIESNFGLFGIIFRY